MLVAFFAYPLQFTAEVTDDEWDYLHDYAAITLCQRYLSLCAEHPNMYRITAQDDDVSLLFKDLDEWSRFAGLEQLGAEGHVDFNLDDPERQDRLRSWKQQLASVICPL